MQRSIFRKVALDRLQSPEQLDQLLHLRPASGRLDFPALGERLHDLYQAFLHPTKSVQRRPRVKTPTVLQMESVECGAAALAMILGYYGRIVPLEELRNVCGVSRDGSKASNIVKAAQGYGLKAKGYKKDPDDLPSLPLPLIAFWNFNHYVVVEGFARNRVYLNDPAAGPRVVSSEEFDQSFTGVVLMFSPGPEFTTGGTKTTTWEAVRRRLEGMEHWLVFVALLSLLLLAPGLLIPILARIFVDDVLVAGGTNWITPLLLGLALAAILRTVLLGLQGWLLRRMEARLALRATGEFVWHLLHLPVRFFSQRYAGEIGGRVALNDQVARLLGGALASTAISAIVAVGYVLLMVQYDLLLTVVGAGIALLHIVVLRAVARRQADGKRRLLQDQGQFMGVAFAALHSIETLKATGAESDSFVRWAGYQAKVVNAEQGLAVSSQIAAAVPVLLSTLSTGAILVIGGLRIMDGHLTAGTLVAFHSLMASFLQPFNRAATAGGTAQNIAGSINRLDDVLRYPRDPLAAEDPAETPPDEAPRLSGQVELRNVTFGYSRMDPPLIEDLSLILRPGHRVALVGGSGSGKSTVAKLVAGLYEPWSGDILFDGVPRRELPRAAITNSLALVDQEIALFAGTVRNNLTLWDATIPQAMVVAAARDAAIHDELAARPGGYQSPLDEGGRDVSGGQRQRLEIARALVRNPTILVLDEATSALDPVTEQIVDHNLRRRGCTCIIVAHRLSTIRDADEIVVLERGKVVQRGTHDTLSGVPGPYARLMAAGEPEPHDGRPVLISPNAM